ncbi:O-antigen ligase family protein [Bdellovibrio svalbardensis]|uniref:O-antigen ligase family protein n=1 Tax=Bdellovibrio svalbardensis TaxID=2972972 RepID=A0ABT6DKG7_9BACT|nr:O-antigen ligase family protein [Bdellovibrio svalbardensis]MDG0817360.1 O-antigen ligase family protein [Bdellovibrio svalbardensis]
MLSFVLAIYIRFQKTKKISAGLFIEKLGLANVCILVWIVANLIGYSQNSPMQKDQWDDILSLRWILSFYSFVTLGRYISFNNKVIANGFFALTVLLILSIVWQYYHPMGDNLYGGIERLRGFYHNPNHFSLAIILPLAFILAWEVVNITSERTFNKKNIFTILIFSLVTYGTFTRSAWIGVAATLFALFVLIKNSKFKLSLLTLPFLFLIFFLFNIFSFKERLMYSFQIEKGNSSALRLQIWNVNWNIFKDHPFFGVGFYENVRLVPEYYTKLGLSGETFVSHAHNQFLQILAGSGLVGFIAYCSAFTLGIALFFKSYKSSRDLTDRKVALGGLLVLIAYLASGLTECPMMLHESRAYLLLFVGMCTGYTLEIQHSFKVK